VIVFPEFSVEKLKGKSSIQINKLTFQLKSVEENCVLVDKVTVTQNVNSEDILDENLGAMYKSSPNTLRLSTMLKYIKENKVPYLVTKEASFPNEFGVMAFNESKEKITFQDFEM